MSTGAWEFGGAQQYNVSFLVARAAQIGKPFVFVSFNYRVSGFGFLPGKEVKSSGLGNLGMQDQRFALRWVNSQISRFGGDPEHVVLAGESAGSLSTALQMLTNGGNAEGLFHAAVMMSGSLPPFGDIASDHQQELYDSIVKLAECSHAADTLDCLRSVPYATFKNATDALTPFYDPQTLNLAYAPRVDGMFLTDDAYNLARKGQYSRIPLIIGGCDDEGTLFTLGRANATSVSASPSPPNDIAELPASSGPTPRLSSIFKCSSSRRPNCLRLPPLRSCTPRIPGKARLSAPAQQTLTRTRRAMHVVPAPLMLVDSPQYKRLAAIEGDLVFQGELFCPFPTRYGRCLSMWCSASSVLSWSSFPDPEDLVVPSASHGRLLVTRL